ncbi:MAG: carbohydrate kinase family protein [Deinococcus-Thermus bacterium]|nr:carbohydrate kinase family protein [Deinococcota bacterium]
MAEFLVVGDATVDQMYFVDSVPEPGGEITATRAVMEPGGAGGTMATALARLGHDTRIATRVGTGPFSELALKNAIEAGVSSDLIQVDEVLQTSSVTILVTPDTQRTMITAIGASRALDAAELDAGSVENLDALVMSAYSLVDGPQRDYAVKALELARAAGATTFVDMGTGAVNALRDRLIGLVRKVDYLLMNERELFALTGRQTISEAVSGLASRGIQRLVVKVGEMGSIVITPEASELIDPYDIDGVVDTTGAGDYYTAAFAHAIMRGADLVEAARAGNVAGALNTTEIGAQRAVVDARVLTREARALRAVAS